MSNKEGGWGGRGAGVSAADLYFRWKRKEVEGRVRCRIVW
jgi:hypothetical protein